MCVCVHGSVRGVCRVHTYTRELIHEFPENIVYCLVSNYC